MDTSHTYASEEMRKWNENHVKGTVIDGHWK